MTSSWLARLAAVALGVTAGLVGFTTAAEAAVCPAGTGVTVVVNSSVRCDANGGGNAASNFAAAGHSLRYAAKDPGFVCRVDGIPASDPCGKASPADAYWALFWSNGTSGSWNYASSGVASVRVPKGGWVAFVFQSSNSRRYPSMRPVTKAPPPPAEDKPGRGSSGGGSSGGSSNGTTPRASAPTAERSSAPDRRATENDDPKAEASSAAPTPSERASSSFEGRDAGNDVQRTSEETDTGSAVPWWAATGLAVLLAGGATLVALRRRSQRAG